MIDLQSRRRNHYALYGSGIPAATDSFFILVLYMTDIFNIVMCFRSTIVIRSRNYLDFPPFISGVSVQREEPFISFNFELD